mgnify:FL=1
MLRTILSKLQSTTNNMFNMAAIAAAIVFSFVFREHEYNQFVFFILNFFIFKFIFYFAEFAIFWFYNQNPIKTYKVIEDGKEYTVAEFFDNKVEWYYNGVLHREKGKPAVFNKVIGIKSWYFKGKKVSQKETFLLSNMEKINDF